MQAISVILDKRSADRLRRRYPWVFRSDILNAKDLGDFMPGETAFFKDATGQVLATGYLHPKAQLTGRVLALGESALDTVLFKRKFADSLSWRQGYFAEPYYRMVYAESDGLPGLVVDRFGQTLVVLVNTAGMDRLQSVWLPALQEVTDVENIILKNDSTGRALEGLPENLTIIRGRLPENGRIELVENGVRFYADLRAGQKTGWFYDQRPHRAWVAAQAKNKSVLDVFCHTGAFGITAGVHGAAHVTMTDVSAHALALARDNADLNGLSSCTYIEGKAFDVLEQMEKQSFDIVCVDPPAFVKVKKDMAAGLRGYEKLVKLAAPVVKAGGLLFYASCSSHPTEKEMLEAILTGTSKAGRQASLVYVGTAGADHPMHPMLPETRYLKAFGFRIS